MEILVCNNECTFYVGSKTEIQKHDEDNSLGCRYAEDPDNEHISFFNLLAWHVVG